jgi:hypothetical protein
VSVAEWVLAVERAYVAAATGAPPPRVGGDASRAKAAAAAVASRYLAVGTPRSFGIVIDDPIQLDEAVLALEAHRTWFSPRDIRCTDAALAAMVGGRTVSIDEALAADIVCVHSATPIHAAQLRRGTHVNVLGASAIDDDIVAVITDEPRGLPALAAGLVDGRQLDELTIFVAGDAAIALSAQP